jgi:hypothetical protein
VTSEFALKIKNTFSKLGPSALVLVVGIVAIVAAGMFVFGGPAFGLGGSQDAVDGEEAAAELLPSDSVASFNDTDTDQDGLKDLEEVRYRTDPKNPDTDGDGFKDGDEVAKGFDPASKPGDVAAQEQTAGSAEGASQDTSFLSLLGYKPVGDQVDGLTVGGIGGLSEEENKALQEATLPSGERLGELELDKVLSVTSQPLPSINVSKIKTTDDVSAANLKKYYVDAAGIVLKFQPFPRDYSVNTLFEDLNTFNRDMLEKIKLAAESMHRELSRMTVPVSMVPAHAHALSILQGSREVLDRVLNSAGSPDDTLYAAGRSVFILNEMGALLRELKPLVGAL